MDKGCLQRALTAGDTKRLTAVRESLRDEAWAPGLSVGTLEIETGPCADDGHCGGELIVAG
jgi:hypothetical protein